MMLSASKLTTAHDIVTINLTGKVPALRNYTFRIYNKMSGIGGGEPKKYGLIKMTQKPKPPSKG